MPGFAPWWKTLKQNIDLHTFDHNFGLVVPCPSGFAWEQQTEGVMCHHVSIEGIYIPLPIPETILKQIQDANYNYNPKLVTKHWSELRRWLKENERFEFEEVNAPKGMPENQEGLQWIKILKWQSAIDTRHLLEGEIVCLFYPNCD